MLLLSDCSDTFKVRSVNIKFFGSYTLNFVNNAKKDIIYYRHLKNKDRERIKGVVTPGVHLK